MLGNSRTSVSGIQHSREKERGRDNMETCQKWPCYIGVTKTGAGIFLSGKIIERKRYGKYVHTEQFENFAEAEKIFFERYGTQISQKDFRVNKMYTIIDKAMYSVFSTPHVVGLTYTEHFYENMEKILPSDSGMAYCRHNLEYQEAVDYVRGHFAKWYAEPKLYINFAVRLHQPIYLTDVKRANGLNQ